MRGFKRKATVNDRCFPWASAPKKQFEGCRQYVQVEKPEMFGCFLSHIRISTSMWFTVSTLPETNSSHLKIGHPKRKIVFQPSIFRGYVSSREGIYIYTYRYPVSHSCLSGWPPLLIDALFGPSRRVKKNCGRS